MLERSNWLVMIYRSIVVAKLLSHVTHNAKQAVPYHTGRKAWYMLCVSSYFY